MNENPIHEGWVYSSAVTHLLSTLFSSILSTSKRKNLSIHFVVEKLGPGSLRAQEQNTRITEPLKTRRLAVLPTSAGPTLPRCYCRSILWPLCTKASTLVKGPKYMLSLFPQATWSLSQLFSSVATKDKTNRYGYADKIRPTKSDLGQRQQSAESFALLDKAKTSSFKISSFSFLFAVLDLKMKPRVSYVPGKQSTMLHTYLVSTVLHFYLDRVQLNYTGWP